MVAQGWWRWTWLCIFARGQARGGHFTGATWSIRTNTPAPQPQSTTSSPQTSTPTHPNPPHQPALIDMVSAGTLMVFAVVGLALIYHRYVRPHGATAKDRMLPGIGLAVLTASGIGGWMLVFFACVCGGGRLAWLAGYL